MYQYYSRPHAPVEDPGISKATGSLTAELPERWSSATPWGGPWAMFFSLFQRAQSLGQPGITASDLFHLAYGDSHATMPQIRFALERALDDGLIVRLDDETPQGTHEYYLLNPESLWLHHVLTPSAAEPQNINPTESALALRKFCALNFHHLAIEHGFEGASFGAKEVVNFFNEGPYTMTEIYRSPRVYPTGAAGFTLPVREFIDAVVHHATETGIVTKEENRAGPDTYHLAPGIADLI